MRQEGENKVEFSYAKMLEIISNDLVDLQEKSRSDHGHGFGDWSLPLQGLLNMITTKNGEQVSNVSAGLAKEYFEGQSYPTQYSAKDFEQLHPSTKTSRKQLHEQVGTATLILLTYATLYKKNKYELLQPAQQSTFFNRLVRKILPVSYIELTAGKAIEGIWDLEEQENEDFGNIMRHLWSVEDVQADSVGEQINLTIDWLVENALKDVFYDGNHADEVEKMEAGILKRRLKELSEDLISEVLYNENNGGDDDNPKGPKDSPLIEDVLAYLRRQRKPTPTTS